MLIREARPDEHAIVGEVTVAGYRVLGGTPLSSRYEAELRDVGARTAGAVVLVAVVHDDDSGRGNGDGRVVGTVTYVRDAESPYAEDLRHGEAGIRMLSVVPSAQRQGAGAALVAACVARARHDGAQGLFLHSTPWMTAAHRLYERLGFRRVPDRDWTPVPEVPLLAFRLDLTGTVDLRPGGGTGETQGA